MRFREIIDSPCGIRYLFDTLELQSGFARKVLLDREMMTRPEDISAAYASLKQTIALVDADRRKVADMQFRLQDLRDIGGTLHALADGAVLDEVELFEIKHLAMLAGTLDTGCDLQPVVSLLDPDGLRIGTFYLYDSYSATLRTLRRQAKEKADDPAVQEALTDEEYRIRQQLCEKLRPFAGDMQRTLLELARLDISLAMALQVRGEGLVLPATGDGTDLRGMFHPELRHILRKDGKDFQPVDFRLQTGVPATLIGANMGGKTVVLKTLCLIQYLYQFGFGIPAAEAVLTPFESIHFCIGDEQDERKGLSSFAAEMQRIGRMIAAAEQGKPVLALVDEPARTTNPVEGTALVRGLLARLSGFGNLALVLTTHYTVEHTGQCWRVCGLVPGSQGRRMDYRLLRTEAHEVPHEALNIARELGIDARWIDLSDTLMNR